VPKSCERYPGGASVAGLLITPSAHVTEVMAHQEKLAALSLTCQHSLIEYQPVLGMLRALPTTEAVPLARIPLE
jgi:hypothetical protein